MPSGVYIRTEEHKKKQGFQKNNSLWKKTKGRKGLIPWNKGLTGVYSEESLKKMSKVNKGKKLSEEHRQKISIANMGRKGLKGKNHPWWKGGKGVSQLPEGYITIHKPEHPYSWKGSGYIKRSRVVMEEKIGRYLTKEEIVHHINGIKDDDRPENLMLFKNHKEHLGFHASQRPKKPRVSTKTIIPEGWANTKTLIKLLNISETTAFRLRRDNKIIYKPLKKKTFVYPVSEIERIKKVIYEQNSDEETVSEKNRTI